MNHGNGERRPLAKGSAENNDAMEGLDDFVSYFDNERAFSPISSSAASHVASVPASPRKMDATRLSASASSSGAPAKGPQSRLDNFDSSSDRAWREGSDSDSFSPRVSRRRGLVSKEYSADMLRKKEAPSQQHTSVFFGSHVISPLASDFHRACQFGHISSLEHMLRKGEVIDIDLVDSMKNTGLHEAAINVQWEVVRLLLKKGASVTAKNVAGKSPIDLALSTSLAAFMREFGNRSDWAHRYQCIRHVWNDEFSALQSVCHGGTDNVKALVNEEDSLGYTAVHAAALFDRVECLRLLLSHGADINKASIEGITPLHEACRWSSQECIKALVEAGADIEAENSQGHAPFAMANRSLRRFLRRLAKERNLPMSNMTEGVPQVHFEDVSDVSEHDAVDRTEDVEMAHEEMPIFGRSAALSREERKLQQMLAIMNKISPVKAIPSSGRKAKSAESIVKPPDLNDEEPTKTRLKRKPSMQTSRTIALDPNFRDNYGANQLHKVSSMGKLKEVRQLLTKAPHLVNAVDNAGYSALHEAALNGHLPVVKVLLDSGADIDLASGDGDTALHDAAENGHEEVVVYLLHAGANRIARNAKGKTADEVASEDRIRLLIKSPAPPAKLAATVDAKSKTGDRRKRIPADSLDKERANATGSKKKANRRSSASHIGAPKMPLERKLATKAPVSRPAELPAVSPKPIPGAEHHGPLLLVSVGEPHGWFFLSPQMETIYQAGMVNSKAQLKKAHSSLYGLALTEKQRYHLIASPLMKRLPELRKILSKASGDHEQFYLLEKDSVYAVFASHGLTFGNISVIYLDLQRILRSSLSASMMTPTQAVPATANNIPPKMKMKMARKGSSSGPSLEPTPLLQPALPDDLPEAVFEGTRDRSNSADNILVVQSVPEHAPFPSGASHGSGGQNSAAVEKEDDTV